MLATAIPVSRSSPTVPPRSPMLCHNYPLPFEDGRTGGRQGAILNSQIPRVGASALAAIGSQAALSLGGIFAVLSVSRSQSVEEFGAFALLYTALTTCAGATRAYYGTGFMLGTNDPAAERNSRLKEAYAVVIVLSVAISALGVVISSAPLTNGVTSSPVTLATLLALPVACIYELLRSYAIAEGIYKLVLSADSLRMVGYVAVLVLGPQMSGSIFYVSWLSVSLAGLSVMALRVRAKPAFSGLLDGLKRSRRIQVSTLGVSSLSGFTSLLFGFVVTGFGGSAMFAALRGASALFGPLNSLFVFLDTFILGSLARAPAGQRLRLWSAIAISCLLAVIAWATVLLLFGGYFADYLLGETWEQASAVLPIMAWEYLMLTVVGVSGLVLKVYLKAGALIRNKIASSTIILIGSVLVGLTSPNTVSFAVVSAVAASSGALLAGRIAIKSLKGTP